jgi:hypothetical protein
VKEKLANLEPKPEPEPPVTRLERRLPPVTEVVRDPGLRVDQVVRKPPFKAEEFVRGNPDLRAMPKSEPTKAAASEELPVAESVSEAEQEAARDTFLKEEAVKKPKRKRGRLKTTKASS